MPLRRLLPGPAIDVDAVDAYRVPAGPHVRANMVASADGAASHQGRVGPLTSPADQEVLHALRGLADVVLVGAGTVRAEGYGGPLIPASLSARRRAEGRAEHPRLAVVSGRLDLDLTAPVFTDAPRRPLLVTCADAPDGRVRAAERVADVLVAGVDRVDLPTAVGRLVADGAHVLSEGGPHLLAQLVAASLLDELCLTVAPSLVAGTGVRVTAGPELDPPVDLALTLALIHIS